MRVSIVSHSYTAEENQKNIDAITDRTDVNVVLPRAIEDRIFNDMQLSEAAASDPNYRAYRRMGLGDAQYLLATPDMNFRAFDPDIVHVEYDPWSAIFWQALACRNVFAPRAKIACTVKNNTYRRYPGWRGTLKDDLAHMGIKRVDCFLAASRSVANLYEEYFGVAGESIRILQHLGVDTDLYAPATEPRPALRESVVVGYCGRLDEDKGVSDLVEAIGMSRESSGSDVRLELLGNGALREALIRQAESRPWLTVREPVPHDQVPAFLRGLDLFVLPSRVSEDHEEHDAHALLEAMAVGLPCVGTHSGITPEIVGDGSGVLARPNSAEALHGALAELIAAPEKRQELAERARSRALASFSVGALAERKSEIYEEILDAG
jgi:glycosyltransferase involved in cell wall biosynthesis